MRILAIGALMLMGLESGSAETATAPVPTQTNLYGTVLQVTDLGDSGAFFGFLAIKSLYDGTFNTMYVLRTAYLNQPAVTEARANRMFGMFRPNTTIMGWFTKYQEGVWFVLPNGYFQLLHHAI